MSEAVQTLEGWYALHDFRLMDWNAWHAATPQERKHATDELQYISCPSGSNSKTIN